MKWGNVRVIPDAGDVENVGADTIAKLSAETSRDRSFAAWDQRIVIPRATSRIHALGEPFPSASPPEIQYHHSK